MRSADEVATQQIPKVLVPRRRRLPALAAAVAMAVVGILVLTLSGDDSAAVRSGHFDPAPTTVTGGQGTATTAVPGPGDEASPPTTLRTATTPVPPTTAPPSPTTVPERLTADARLSLQGVGPVHIGMTLDQASAAAGMPVRLMEMPPGPECRYAYPDLASGTGDELGFMMVNGRIVRIDVGVMGPDRIRTVSGIGKGNTEAEVQATYPGRIRIQPHPYIRNGRYLVYVPSDPGLQHLSMIFETVDGRVFAFRAGLLEQVSWTEGCS